MDSIKADVHGLESLLNRFGHFLFESPQILIILFFYFEKTKPFMRLMVFRWLAFLTNSWTDEILDSTVALVFLFKNSHKSGILSF